MKRNLLVLTFLTLLLSFTVANGTANVRILVDSFAVGPSTMKVAVGWSNDVVVTGASIGLRVYISSGAPTFQLDSAKKNTALPRAAGAFNLPDWFFTVLNAGTVDSLLAGGAALPPAGLAIGPDTDTLYRMFFTVGTDTGHICIDSCTKIGEAGDWLFDPPPFPTFNSDQGPVCFRLYVQPCQAPVFVAKPAGDQLMVDHCTGGTFQFTANAVEVGKVIDSFVMVSGPGSISVTGLYTAPAGVPGTTPVTVRVWNSCPASKDYTFNLVRTNAGLQYTSCPSLITVSCGTVIDQDLGLDNFDCDVIAENAVITPPTTNAPTVSGGVFHLATTCDDPPDIGTHHVVVTGSDGNGEEAVCEFDLTLIAGSLFQIVIEKEEGPTGVGAFQGQYTELSIFAKAAGDLMGGYNFLIAYDASALTFVSAQLGDAIDCWEFFQYRFGPFGNCGGTCPSGMLRLVAMREANNGPHHPTGCPGAGGAIPPMGELAKIKFYVTNDRTFECQFVPVYFYWLACGDNTISDITGNKLYISNHVYNINWVGVDPFYELIDPHPPIDETDHIYGTFESCLVPNGDKPIPERNIDFYNGGVDIACANEIDLRGDINLNNVANEVADAVLYTNYFIYGLPVFTINLEGQVAASDVNNDGRVLTVGDLVYLIRILTGDAAPFTKLSPYAHEAVVNFNGSVVSTNAPVDIGAAMFVFSGQANVSLLADGMEMKSDLVDGQTRVLVYNIGTHRIPAGNANIISADGAQLTDAVVSDYYGNLMTTNLHKRVVPTSFALRQNYPNPFNPSTEIAFELPIASQWTLDIYNVAGQLVKSFSGYDDAGVRTLRYDAAGMASGIYFYKIVAGNFTDTKKMILMK